jgi:hypothetical protein
MTSLLNFIKIYQLVKKLVGEWQADRQTDRQVDDPILAYIFPLGRNVG